MLRERVQVELQIPDGFSAVTEDSHGLLGMEIFRGRLEPLNHKL